MYNPERRSGQSPKLDQSWEGPYAVVYRVQRSPNAKPKVIQINRPALHRTTVHSSDGKDLKNLGFLQMIPCDVTACRETINNSVLGSRERVDRLRTRLSNLSLECCPQCELVSCWTPCGIESAFAVISELPSVCF
ncbi:hypothetical protein AVEN_149936-1 [Araneus ventricosus]|uniref:Uncharacterized protein n=1 Tax=Araneus ventricosus TaxID=182803 RepID=A0A4Y2LZJ9_ARAVE|nr:hypothetical protein AVEN_149936-1 [Araneus ventricosus]